MSLIALSGSHPQVLYICLFNLFLCLTGNSLRLINRMFSRKNEDGSILSNSLFYCKSDSTVSCAVLLVMIWSKLGAVIMYDAVYRVLAFIR